MILLKHLIFESNPSMEAEDAARILDKLVKKSDRKARGFRSFDHTKVVLTVSNRISEQELDEILVRANLLGYFPSAWYDDEITVGNPKPFSKQEVLNYIKHGKVYTKYYEGPFFNIVFEKKYDHKLYPSDPGAIAYHVSPTRKEPKIMRIGLVPKANAKKGNHPPRIYMARKIEELEHLLNYFPNDSYTFYEVDLSDLNLDRYMDPQFVHGFYVYSNIPPQHLKVVKRIRKKQNTPV